MIRYASLPVLLILSSCAAHAQPPSTCFGTTANGSLENGRKLPRNGPNFSAYSTIGHIAGRTWVHSTVHEIVLEAYEALKTTVRDKVFVYGETGKKSGGEFKPHKTHRNGLSVDFMVPLIDQSGKSIPLPTSIFNKWGYDLEFDTNGKLDELTIDAEAIAEHIYHLHRFAEGRRIGIWRVIFDPALQPLLHTTSRWPYLRKHVSFSTKRSWVRHDEHYHIDFVVPCKPNKS